MNITVIAELASSPRAHYFTRLFIPGASSNLRIGCEEKRDEEASLTIADSDRIRDFVVHFNLRRNHEGQWVVITICKGIFGDIFG